MKLTYLGHSAVLIEELKWQMPFTVKVFRRVIP